MWVDEVAAASEVVGDGYQRDQDDGDVVVRRIDEPQTDDQAGHQESS